MLVQPVQRSQPFADADHMPLFLGQSQNRNPAGAAALLRIDLKIATIYECIANGDRSVDIQAELAELIDQRSKIRAADSKEGLGPIRAEPRVHSFDGSNAVE
jgi:hypothetical protein